MSDRPSHDRDNDRDQTPQDRERRDLDRDRSPSQERERPTYSDHKPAQDRDRPSYGDRKPSPDRPSYGDRDRRPSQDRDRPSFSDRDRRPSQDRDRPSYGDRDRRPSQDRDRPSFGDRDRRPSQDRDRLSYGDRDRKPSQDRAPRDFKDRKDFKDRDRKEFRDGPPKRGLMEQIHDLDTDILRLVVKRTRMRERLSEHQAGTKERDLRTAWEDSASRVSRDPRLLRDFFGLLQQISVNPVDADYAQAFNLAPAGVPAEVDIAVAASTRQTRLRMALAAGSGTPCTLHHVLLNTQVVSCLKMFNQAGAMMRWEEDPDRVECAQSLALSGAGKPVIDKVIHVGEEALNLYLLIFQMLTRPARLKFMGENDLRNLDLSALRHFLPSLGCRLTSVVPGQDGLPARMEASGMLPEAVTVPADLPSDAVLAFLMATIFWSGKVRVDLSENMARTEEALHLLRACGATVEDSGQELVITPPEKFVMPEGGDMDLLVAFPLLAFAGCSNGESTLHGHWPVRHPLADAALTLLRTVSHVTVEDNTVHAQALTDEDEAPAFPDIDSLPAKLTGPALALYLHRNRGNETCVMPALPAETDEVVVEGFLAALGFTRDGDTLSRTEPTRVPWAAPSPWWGLGLALAAFSFPQLRLSNPGVVSSQIPHFWTLYNSLPSPKYEPKKAEQEDTVELAPARRRVLAGFMPESEMAPALDLYEED